MQAALRIMAAATVCLLAVIPGFAGQFKRVRYWSGAKELNTVAIYTQGGRQRIESGSAVTIHQPDRGRTLIADTRSQTYRILPDAWSSNGECDSHAPLGLRETGERRRLFGIDARRMKASVQLAASGAAPAILAEMEGWYVEAESGGRREALQYAIVSFLEPGAEPMVMMMETLELVRRPLDRGLFEVPEGYEESPELEPAVSASDSLDAAVIRQLQAEGFMEFALMPREQVRFVSMPRRRPIGTADSGASEYAESVIAAALACF